MPRFHRRVDPRQAVGRESSPTSRFGQAVRRTRWAAAITECGVSPAISTDKGEHCGPMHAE